ncbi:MAG: PQQ-binding-like beta-propeller repeat protein [Candidatus Sumerlaeota bacterium]|nr:PQQ-binding-like beta-propeller repeat protein [Candidatus Sumerlaeota bacterium]
MIQQRRKRFSNPMPMAGAIAVSLSLLFACLILAPPGARAQTDWPNFQHDLQHTGHTPSLIPSPFEIDWATTLVLQYYTAADQLGLCVSDGNLIIISSYSTKQSVADTSSLRIWALDIATGAIVWQRPINGNVAGSPQIVNDKVVYAVWDARQFDSDASSSTLYVVNLGNGGLLWARQFPDVRVNAPAVAQGLVILPVLGDHYDPHGNQDVIAYDENTGAQVWRTPIGERGVGTLGSFHPYQATPPCALNDRIYLLAHRSVCCLNLADGKILWRKLDFSGVEFWELYPLLTVADGKVFFADYSHNNGPSAVFAVDAITSSDLWQWDSDGYASADDIMALSYYNGMVYTAVRSTEMDDKLVALNAANGAKIGQSTDINDIYFSPIIAGDGTVWHNGTDFKIFTPDLSQRLYDFDRTRRDTLYLLGGHSITYLSNRIIGHITTPANSDFLTLTALRHDITPPVAIITDPGPTIVNPPGRIDVMGTAYDFNISLWRLEYAPLSDPSNWTEISSDTYSAVNNALATMWEASALGDGEYTIRLTVTDDGDLTATASISLTQDRTPPQIHITSPHTSDTFETVVITVTGTGSDNMGLALVQVWDSESGVWHDAVGTATWAYTWTGKKPVQTVTFQCRGIDWVGNIETPSGQVTVFVVSKAQLLVIYPESHATTSVVMQGGHFYRTVKVVDATSQPLENIRVYYAKLPTGTGYAKTGADGVANLDVDSLDLTTSSARITTAMDVALHITRLRYLVGADDFDLTPIVALPSIPVRILPREAEHFWKGGLSKSLKAGITAYVAGGCGGGTKVSIDNAQNLSVVQSFDAKIGVGVKAGPEFNLGVADAEAKVGAEIDFLFRGDQGFNMGNALCGDLGNADCRSRRKAYAGIMIASLAQTASILSDPTVTVLINALVGGLTQGVYSDYLEHQKILAGIGVQAGGGASTSLGFESQKGSSGEKAKASIGLSVIDGSVSLAFLIGASRYPQEQRLGMVCVQEVETKLSVLSFQAAGNEVVSATDFFGLAGANNSFTFTEEVRFDYDGAPREFILSINDGSQEVIYRFSDFDRLQQILASSGSNFKSLAQSFGSNSGGGLQLGFQGISNELGRLFGLFQGIPFTYERKDTHNVREFDFTFALDFNVQIITVGLESKINYSEGREYVSEEGLFLGTEKHVLATYAYDTYVQGDTHTMGNLVSGVLDGTWTYVEDAVNWIKGTAKRAVAWIIRTNPLSDAGVGANDAATTSPWARLSGPPYAVPQDTDVAILGYPPDPNPYKGLTVVGHCFNLQPEDLQVLKPLSLEIGYGLTPMPAGAQESQLALFFWDNAIHRWRAVAGATSNTLDHEFATSITQLGTYAIGIDLTTPVIQLLPTASEGFTTPSAALRALIYDEVSGVSLMEAQLDGVTAPSDYDTSGQILSIRPSAPLAEGLHSLAISATDGAGNAGSVTTNVIVDSVAPVAQISSPASGAAIRGMIEVIGTANDANFAFYTVQFIGRKTKGQWWIGLPSSSPVNSGLLARFDTRLLPDDTYTIILRALDKAGNETSAQSVIRSKNRPTSPFWLSY